MDIDALWKMAITRAGAAILLGIFAMQYIKVLTLPKIATRGVAFVVVAGLFVLASHLAGLPVRTPDTVFGAIVAGVLAPAIPYLTKRLFGIDPDEMFGGAKPL